MNVASRPPRVHHGMCAYSTNKYMSKPVSVRQRVKCERVVLDRDLPRAETDLNDENRPVTESESSEGAIQPAHVV